MRDNQTQTQQTQNNRPLRQSLKEYARGITGGLLFSFPMLYTMEVWWAGFSAGPLKLLALVVATYVLLLGYNRFAGMRPDVSWKSVLVDSVEEMGIGLLLAFGVLFMISRIDFADMSIDEIMGKVIIEAMAVSIGVSIGTAQLGEGGVSEDKAEEDERDLAEAAFVPDKQRVRAAVAVLSVCGAIIIGGNIAPTEEVIVIALEASPIHIFAMAVASLLLSIVIVYFSEFKGSSTGVSRQELAFEVTIDTCISYLMALVSSAFLLWFFGRFAGVSFAVAFSQVITLGLVASLGASAGRLLIK
ncbi:TIGR02587 family membrane protein [Pontibacter akesuensis]|uniref:Putative integral membrane protein TIGR02587 n=1 Tax=Pontibacter akesuensis TaxID=388950 RepID=A0A1I7GTR6_9BACT|nr:TIGR02587 family membrane protein [Pontibacter akesuensis]GHA55108.1 membrane protein [Pontibacter akesuensis]SFU51853.1 putative integral membrane protein TIGR02587 [Pontibacter akesuensis]